MEILNLEKFKYSIEIMVDDLNKYTENVILAVNSQNELLWCGNILYDQNTTIFKRLNTGQIKKIDIGRAPPIPRFLFFDGKLLCFGNSSWYKIINHEHVILEKFGGLYEYIAYHDYCSNFFFEGWLQKDNEYKLLNIYKDFRSKHTVRSFYYCRHSNKLFSCCCCCEKNFHIIESPQSATPIITSHNLCILSCDNFQHYKTICDEFICKDNLSTDFKFIINNKGTMACLYANPIFKDKNEDSFFILYDIQNKVILKHNIQDLSKKIRAAIFDNEDNLIVYYYDIAKICKVIF